MLEWGGKRLPGQADAEITCQTAHSLLTSALENAPLTACFLLYEFRGAGGQGRAPNARNTASVTGGGSNYMEEAGVLQHVQESFTAFQMCHAASQRAGDGSRARQRVNVRSTVPRSSLKSHGGERGATFDFCETVVLQMPLKNPGENRTPNFPVS